MISSYLEILNYLINLTFFDLYCGHGLELNSHVNVFRISEVVNLAGNLVIQQGHTMVRHNYYVGAIEHVIGVQLCKETYH